MYIKISKLFEYLAILGLFIGLLIVVSPSANAIENLPLTAAADKVSTHKTLSAGFYQFNDLEIFKSPAVDEPPTTLEVIQKNEKSCVVYENGKTNLPLPCLFNNNENNTYLVQIDERTTLVGNNQEPALLSDFLAGEKINVLGWLSADSKTIRAAVVKSLAIKNFHQSFSGTIKKVTGNGFIITLSNGDEISVKTPIVEGAQVTVKGVFDKINNTVDNVLSILIKSTIVIQEEPVAEPETPPTAPSAKPSTLFKNFLKVFGL